ncbi:MAG: type II toxin-antitoxin system RelE/ParE family toxin [Planctomycetaceae bacterium]
MTLPIEYAEEVREDVDSAYAWYEDQQSGLGERFLVAVADIVEKIQKHPRQFGRVRGEVRAGLIRDFPYVVYFRLEEARIVVIAVLHGRRDPQVWMKRM